MDYLYILIFALVGLTLTSVLVPLVLRWAAIGKRLPLRMYHHTHKEPVSRLGGIALSLTFVVVVLVILIWFPESNTNVKGARWVIVGGSLAMFVLGLWDDLRALGARKKLIGQLLISIWVCLCGVQVENFQNPISGELYHLGMWSWVVTIFWLVTLTNIINLVDGVDGLAGGICLMLMGLMVFAGFRNGSMFPMLCAAGMFGALVGFLRYNFPPARIYMGDGGAYFLGFLIAILALVYSQKGTLVAALVAPLLALALPILDVSLAIARRGLRGLPLFRADREHIHHRMMKSGFSRTRTVLVLYGISLLFLVFAFIVFWMRDRELPVLLGFIFLTLLLMARMFDFSRHWLAVGRFWEDSQELRRETEYAMTLARWLELEAERTESLEKLWADFSFLAGRLGFARVKLTLGDGERVVGLVQERTVPTEYRQVHDFSDEALMVLQLEGDDSKLALGVFHHVSELAVEAWVKASTQWQKTTGRPLLFNAPQSAATAIKVSRSVEAASSQKDQAGLKN